VSAVLKALDEERALLGDVCINWYPLLQGFGVRMLLPHETVRAGDFQLSAYDAGKALYRRPSEIGLLAGACHSLTFRYTAWAGDASPEMIASHVVQQIRRAQDDAWAALVEAVDLYRGALTTGKPHLISMRDLRVLEIMDKNDFGCRVTFDSITGYVWRGGEDEDVFGDL
jgi:hypothetical protein